MEQNSVPQTNRRNIWIRGLSMLLMACAYQLTGTLLFVVAILQFLISVATKTPNDRLCSFGRSLGAYLRQIAHFLTFHTENIPFPFNDWPSGD